MLRYTLALSYILRLVSTRTIDSVGYISNNPNLNVKKTKEMIIDFRVNRRTDLEPLAINGNEVEIVDVFKFLSTHLDNKLI